ncbi:MAG: HAD family hydrolase [Endomicrobiia bacterium]
MRCKSKAIFLDRDGTINEDVGDFCSVEKLKFIEGSLEALKLLQKEFLLFIITNQTGIDKGIFTEEEFLEFNKTYLDILYTNGIEIKQVLYCPHKKEKNCVCRKPSTYFINLLKDKYDLDLSKSFSIGDHPHDVEMGFAAGTKTIYLLTGHGQKHLEELVKKPDFVAKNLYEASLWILNNIYEKQNSC